MIKIYPYKQGSKSAKDLATALSSKVLKIVGSSYKRNPNHLIVNWGSSEVPEHLLPVLNPPELVLKSVNKLSFFTWAKEKCSEFIPDYWRDREGIPPSVFDSGGMVVCRTHLAASGGAGVHIARGPEEVVEAPLYTLYVKKKDEYRVHLGQGSIIAVQRKARKLSHEQPNWLIRNHKNGFVYVRDVNPPEAVLIASTTVFEASGLDFGAVDVIYNEAQGRAYVLEINTAPGLQGQTVLDYANFLKGLGY